MLLAAVLATQSAQAGLKATEGPPSGAEAAENVLSGTMPKSVSAVFKQIEQVNAAGMKIGDETVNKTKPACPTLREGKARLLTAPAKPRQAASKSPRKAAKLKSDDYFSRDSSYYGNDNYSHMELKIENGKATIINVYSYGDTLNVDYDVTTGTFSIPVQKVKHFDTYGDVYACPASFEGGDVSYSTTGSIGGTVLDDGTITLQPWGIFVIDGDYAGSVVNAFYMSAWHPANATINTYNAKHVLTSYKAYVEQNATDEIRVYNFSNSGNAAFASLKGTNELRFSPQEVWYNADYGAFYFYPLDTLQGKIYTSQPVKATYADGTITLDPWVSIEQNKYKTRLITAYTSTIETTAKITWSAIATYALTGDGTASNPYKLSSAADLKGLSDNVTAGNSYTGKHFKVTADIDMAVLGNSFHAIGTVDEPFAGIVDGEGHTIKNMRVTGRGFPGQGLFGVTAAGTAISNLKIDNARVEGAGQSIGTLAGNFNGVARNITVTRSAVKSQNQYAGGLIGFADGKVFNCSYQGTVSARGTQGGLIGYARDTIANCHTNATVTMTEVMSNETGGTASAFVGVFSPADGMPRPTITDCYASGTVRETSGYGVTGGMVGVIYGGEMRRCFNVAYISSPKGSTDYTMGGLLGTLYNSIVSDCYNAGTMTRSNKTSNYVGGLCGFYALTYVNGVPSMLSTMTNCYNSALIVSTPTDGNNHRGVWGYQFKLHDDDNPAADCFKNCYTDVVFTSDADTLFGTNTATLTSGTLPAGFSPEVWAAQDGFYPQLKVHQGTAGSDLSVAAALLSYGEDIHKVKHVVNLTHSGQVSWSFQENNKYVTSTASMSIVGDSIVIGKEVRNNVLVARTSAGQEKYITLAAVPDVFAGKGTAENPYQISDMQDFIRLDSLVRIAGQPYKGDYFLMTNDIDFGYSRAFRGVGASNNVRAFSAVFDGGGHAIHRLYIKNWLADPSDPKGETYITDNDSTYSYGGLFTYVDGVVKNLVVAPDCRFNLYDYSAPVVGILAGGRVENVRNYADVRAKRTYVGGIVSRTTSGSVVTHCYNAGNIICAASNSGGIVAFNQGLISYCQNDGDISTIHDSTSTAYAGAQWYAGGIASSSQGVIDNCINNGTITAYRCVGGLTGGLTLTTSGIISSINTGLVVNLNKTITEHGGMIGNMNTIGDCQHSYYDAAVVTDGAAMSNKLDGVYGLSTAELISGRPLEGLSTDTWDFEEGKYPVLKEFKDERAAVARRNTYVKFTPGVDRDDVQGSVALAKAAPIVWSLKLNRNFGIQNDSLKVLVANDTALINDTLVAVYGNTYEKYYPLSSLPHLFEGLGNAESPYLIKSTADYHKLASFVNSTATTFKKKHFLLVNDLDFSNDTTTFQPIATGAITFEAEFNGNGKTIAGYHYVDDEKSYSKYSGLFGNIGAEGYVHDMSVKGAVKAYQHVGGLAGRIYGVARNITNHSKLETTATTSSYIGGIAARLETGGVIDSCENAADATITTAAPYVAGIVAEMQSSSTVSNCVNLLNIETAKNYVCGIAYSCAGGKIVNCLNKGNLSTSAKYAAGIVGTTSRADSILHCENQGTIYAYGGYAAGIVTNAAVNSLKAGYIAHCRNTGSVTGNGYTGGIAGNVVDGNTLEYCVNEGAITGVRTSSSGSYTGGIVAYLYGSSSNPCYARYCLNKGTVTSDASYVGGIAGDISHAEVMGLYNTGKVKATHYVSGTTNKYAIYVGGIAGMMSGNGRVLWNIADVEAEGSSVGGIAGQGNGTVSKCFNTGNIHADGQGKSSMAAAAGIWGLGRPAINGCVNLGTISGPDMISGVIGQIYNTGSVTNCYNAGLLAPTAEAPTQVRSLLYGDGVEITCTGNVYLGDINKQYPDVDHGIALSKEQLFAGTSMAAFYKTNRAAYPIPDSLAAEPVVRYCAADLAFEAGDSAQAVTQNFWVGALDSVEWTSSSNISIDPAGVASAHVGKGWVKKSITWQGIALSHQYDIDVLQDTGIGAIQSNDSDKNADRRIFGIDGRYLGTDLGNLPPGIYVRNGKKLVK